MHLIMRPSFSKRIQSFLCSGFTIRLYTTESRLGSSSPKSSKKSLSDWKDNEFLPWDKLTVKSKVFRATQQTFNVGLIVCGVILCGGVIYFLYREVLSPDSEISHFNKSFDRIRRDPRCIALLGDANKITAHGEGSGAWRRTRPLMSIVHTDQNEIQHLLMKFNVNGSKNSGIVNVHMIKRLSDNEFSYRVLKLDVKGKPTVYLEYVDGRPITTKKFRLFGVSWR